jgi:hypothetical protein
MAQAVGYKFGKSYILVSDMATPTPAFVAPCGFESLTMTVNIETETTNLPDCTNPDLAGWLAIAATSKQMTLEGEGVLDTSAMKIWRDIFMNNTPYVTDDVPMRLFIDLNVANNGGRFDGTAVLTNWQQNGRRGGFWQFQVAAAFSGKPTFTAAI